MFEALTLIQTQKKEVMPIILFDKEFWTRLINFDYFVESGVISESDLDLIHFVNSPEEAMAILKNKLRD